MQRIPSPPRRSKRTRTHRAQAATPYRELAYQLSDPISVLSGFSDVLLGLLHRLRALASMHSLQQLLHVLLRHLLVHGHLPSPRVLRHLLPTFARPEKKTFFPLFCLAVGGGGDRGAPGRMKGKKGAETELKARSALFAGVHTGFRLPQVPAQCDAC